MVFTIIPLLISTLAICTTAVRGSTALSARNSQLLPQFLTRYPVGYYSSQPSQSRYPYRISQFSTARPEALSDQVYYINKALPSRGGPQHYKPIRPPTVASYFNPYRKYANGLHKFYPRLDYNVRGFSRQTNNNGIIGALLGALGIKVPIEINVWDTLNSIFGPRIDEVQWQTINPPPYLTQVTNNPQEDYQYVYVPVPVKKEPTPVNIFYYIVVNNPLAVYPTEPAAPAQELTEDDLYPPPPPCQEETNHEFSTDPPPPSSGETPTELFPPLDEITEETSSRLLLANYPLRFWPNRYTYMK